MLLNEESDQKGKSLLLACVGYTIRIKYLLVIYILTHLNRNSTYAPADKIGYKINCKFFIGKNPIMTNQKTHSVNIVVDMQAERR